MTAVGVDVGGTKCLAVALGPDGEVVYEARVPTPASGAHRDLVEAVAGLVEGVGGGGHGPVESVGIGVPGLVDRGGVLRSAPHLDGVADLDLGAELGPRIGVAVTVDNDANCAAWAEFRKGAGAKVDDMVLVTLGTGVGGGIVSDGVLVRGGQGFAGEVGHMAVVADGPPCPCGRRGCWELYASGSALGRLGAEAAHASRGRAILEAAGGDPNRVRGEHVSDAATAGDAEALAVVAEFAGWVALGVANLGRLLDPSMVVIGGGLVDAADIFMEPIRRALEPLTLLEDGRGPLRVEPAALGERAGAIGAAMLGAVPEADRAR